MKCKRLNVIGKGTRSSLAPEICPEGHDALYHGAIRGEVGCMLGYPDVALPFMFRMPIGSTSSWIGFNP
jgi:hypothetical protein